MAVLEMYNINAMATQISREFFKDEVPDDEIESFYEEMKESV